MFTTVFLFAADIFGTVNTPKEIANFGGGTSGGGLIIFVSNLIKVITIVAGLFGLINIISAGYTFLGSNGNPKAAEEAGNKLFMSFIGLMIIVGAFTITAIISLLLFGKADYILNPNIPSATGAAGAAASGSAL